MKKVELPGDPGDLEFNNWVVGMIDRGTGATATQQGAQTQRKTTLGEVELALGEAKARTRGISKFYTHVWKQRAMTFLRLIEGNSDKLDIATVWKKGKNSNNNYKRDIGPDDYMTKSGYTVRVWSQEEKTNQDTQELTTLNQIKLSMPDNPVVSEVYSRKLLEFGKFKPEEIDRAMEFERQKLTMQPMGVQNGMQPGGNGQPQLPAPQPGLPTQ